MLKGTLNIKYTGRTTPSETPLSWEPPAYLSDHGAFDLVAKYNDKLEAAGHRQPGGKPHGKQQGSVKYAGVRGKSSDCEDNG